ncbi:unnamed protein product [Phytophthora fragariaefolia]|uniref:Unnamed protein product n=1 Tax=Phytophthora fragariaefolia TaxID=1490495 RepID=A0A9W6XKU9_9STRA|nr:unnamed protein product [Phytophthora fragariaefolia]
MQDALSAMSVAVQPEVLQWTLMSVNLVGNESITRLTSLKHFSGPSANAASFLIPYGGGLLFSGQDPELGREIWYSDGTDIGTGVLKDIFPGSGSSNPTFLTPFTKDNRVYFAAEGPHLSWIVQKEYQDDCQSFRSSSADPNIYFTVAAVNVWDPHEAGFQTDLFAGIVCYREPPSYQEIWGVQLWATDGTAEGTQRVARISPDLNGADPSHFVEMNQRLYFQAASLDFGAELWSTDGTRAGTYLVADIEFGSRGSEPQFLIVFDSRVFFSADTKGYGRELWFSNGNQRVEFSENQHAVVGTGLLLDICAGAAPSSPQDFAVLSFPTKLSLLLFQADDCVHGPELWSTDGTPSGTVLVLDIRKGFMGSLPRYLTFFAGQVYFQADDGIHGSELWTTDGTSGGTEMLLDVAPGVQGSTPSFLTILYPATDPSGIFVFAAQAEQDRLTEFWQSNGTSDGTMKLFSQSREVVELNVDSLNAQIAGSRLVTITPHPDKLFYLGRESGQGIDFQHDASKRLDVHYAETVDKLTHDSKPQKYDWDEIQVSLGEGFLSALSSTGFASSYTGDVVGETRAINVPPSISMSSKYYAPMRQWIVLAGVEVTDSDAAEGILYVSIAVRNGRLRAILPHRLSARGPTPLHPIADGDTLQKIEFACTVEQAKEIFSNVEYSCDDRSDCAYTLQDQLTVSVDDNGFTGDSGPQVATKTAKIFIIETTDLTR